MSKVSMLCESDNCESETIENQQLMEDDHIIGFSIDFFNYLSAPVNNFLPFHYRVSFNKEVHRVMHYPPPELG